MSVEYRAYWDVDDYQTYDLTEVPLEGEIGFFDNIMTEVQNDLLTVVGDGTSAWNALPFRETVIVESDSDVSIEELRIDNNIVLAHNTHASNTINVNIGTTGVPVYESIEAGGQRLYKFDGSNWHGTLNSDLVQVVMSDSDYTIPDGYSRLEVILPSSGITADRTVTLPTLADNQSVRITLRNFNTTYALFVDGEGAETIEGFDTINLSTDWIQLSGESSEWKRIGQQSERPVAYFRNQQSNNVGGGTATSGAYRTCTINHDGDNSIIGCSRSSNQVIIPVGRYAAIISQVFFQVDRNKIRLQDITAGSTIFTSKTQNAGAAESESVPNTIEIIFDVTAITNLEVQYRVLTTYATTGLGIQANFSENEYYLDCELKKLL